MLRVSLLLLLLACGCLHAAIPPAPRFRLMGVSDGVPNTTVVAMAHDHAGYVWLATHDGLARFDGVGFRVWRHVQGDPTSLPRNVVQALLVDDQDRIWLATEGGGISVLDAERREFRHFRMADYSQIGSDDTWALASHGDELWFGTYAGGLHRLDGEGRITRFMPRPGDPRSLPADTVLALAFDDRGQLWIGTTQGLARWTGHDFERVALPGEEPAALVYSLTADHDRVWVGAASGAFYVESDGTVAVPSWSAMFARPNALLALASDDKGYWIGSKNALWRVDADGIPVPVAVQPGTSNRILALLEQPGGALWLHAAGVGLGYLRSDWRQLAEYQHFETGLSGTLYRGTVEANAGGFWLTGDTGVLERLDEDGLVEHLAPAILASLEGVKPRVVVEDAAGRLWLGHRRGLLRVDRDTAEVLRWDADSGSDATLTGTINLLALAPDGRSIWSSAIGGGVQQRDIDSGRVLRAFPVGAEHGLVSADVEAMQFAPDGRLWLAGELGLLQLDMAQGRFVPIAELVGDEVFAFDFDGHGGLWLHRMSGLEHWQRVADRWQRTDWIRSDEGIPTVESGDLLVDVAGRPWLATPRGLFRWDPESGTVRRYGVEDGLSSQEFVARSMTLSAAGVLVAGLADGGVVLVDTLWHDPVDLAPELRLTSVALRQDGHWQRQALDRPLELDSDDRELRVRLRLLAFDDPSANRYWTWLEGFDTGWVAQGDSGDRVFTGLAAGDYVLRMRAQDSVGNASAEQVFRFSVLPPWWRTPWAYAGFLALFALLSWWLFDAYRTRLKRRNAMQLMEHKRALAEQASLAKTRFLATLGHEVRTPMTGVLGMSELLLGTTLDGQQRGYTQSIRDAGEHLLRLVNDALDLARIEADRLELSEADFDLHAMVDDVAALMAPLAEQRGLAFERLVSDDTPRALRGDVTRVRQILLNLIGNAIKFTEHGSVTLQVSALQRGGERVTGVRFAIRDTGPGLNDEQKDRLFRRFEQAEGARTAARYGGSGLGLAISQELAAAMDGCITVESTPGEGTCFNVELPLPTAVLRAGQPEKAAVDRQPVSEHRSLELLLVEDDPTVAEVIAGLLRTRGHHVVHAGHGLAALAETSGGKFDLALLDLDLPGLDGFALARQLRDRGFAQPLLAITARADADAEPLARAAGFDGFLRKPLTGGMLAGALEDLVPETDARRGRSNTNSPNTN